LRDTPALRVRYRNCWQMTQSVESQPVPGEVEAAVQCSGKGDALTRKQTEWMVVRMKMEKVIPAWVLPDLLKRRDVERIGISGRTFDMSQLGQHSPKVRGHG
jgi:hypothetical protein